MLVREGLVGECLLDYRWLSRSYEWRAPSRLAPPCYTATRGPTKVLGPNLKYSEVVDSVARPSDGSANRAIQSHYWQKSQ
jgi:hypothetical protein